VERRSVTSQLAVQMLDVIGQGDLDRGCALLDGAFEAGASPVELIVDLLAPLLGEVDASLDGGGPAAVTRSRRAVSTLDHVFGYVVDRAAEEMPEPTKGAVLVGSPVGEWHELPSRLVTETLLLDGFDATYLGGSVPEDVFCGALLRAESVVGVGVSVSMRACLASAESLVTAIRGCVAKHGLSPITIAVGGQAVEGPEGARALGADAWAPDARGFALLLDARLGARPERALVARTTA
jgi:methanogenic corrinoid protein MtbC1